MGRAVDRIQPSGDDHQLRVPVTRRAKAGAVRATRHHHIGKVVGPHSGPLEGCARNASLTAAIGPNLVQGSIDEAMERPELRSTERRSEFASTGGLDPRAIITPGTSPRPLPPPGAASCRLGRKCRRRGIGTRICKPVSRCLVAGWHGHAPLAFGAEAKRLMRRSERKFRRCSINTRFWLTPCAIPTPRFTPNMRRPGRDRRK